LLSNLWYCYQFKAITFIDCEINISMCRMRCENLCSLYDSQKFKLLGAGIRKDIFLWKNNKWQLKFHEYSMSQSSEHICSSELLNFLAPIRKCFEAGWKIRNFSAFCDKLHFRMTAPIGCVYVSRQSRNSEAYEAVNWIKPRRISWECLVSFRILGSSGLGFEFNWVMAPRW